MLRALFVLTLLWSIVCVTTKVEYAPPPVVEWRVDTTFVQTANKAISLGKFKITYYWIVSEVEYTGRREIPLYLEDGTRLGYYPKKFVADFKKESVARLRDGRVISYLKKKGAAKVVTEPLGHQGYTLTAFKSVAVDPNLIPLGSRIYIPQYEGLYLGSAGVHNGIFYAHDIGSAVKGSHIDIYIGDKENFKYVMSKSGRSFSLVDVYLLK